MNKKLQFLQPFELNASSMNFKVLYIHIHIVYDITVLINIFIKRTGKKVTTSYTTTFFINPIKKLLYALEYYTSVYTDT